MKATTFNPADIAAVAELEDATRTYIALLDRVQESAHRLSEAGYAGADWLDSSIDQAIATDADGSVGYLLRCVEITRKGEGDLGQHVFHFKEIDLSKDLGEQLREANKNEDERWMTALYGYLFRKGILPRRGATA